ncbi:DUF2017 domain-containing protein [Corynebacterium anserum]|uniref:DUF2017 family protein n=1 Tax=Corynebacterium anserum TaxID=2684406 RepID=A0A7G7YMF4_9CORY|nr:DUF2017 domain-containing protein [Corynebacterium anserum]MBC2681037.1 DUF2017 family protein [Corynebacterium anserum]QNH95674.1 DUF2017 family protein [Corynebacterium anserum]
MDAWTKKKSMMRGTRYITRLEPLEREMLGDSASLVANQLMERVRTAPKDELAEMTGMPSGHAEAPDNPALARLLPSYFADGAEEVEGDAALMRQLNETDIIRQKLLNLRVLCDVLGPDGSVNISLTESEAAMWTNALADIRSYHYEQLKQLIAEKGEDAEQVIQANQYMDWLGSHLDSLMYAMMGDLDLNDLE